jgi:hypothetical protein
MNNIYFSFIYKYVKKLKSIFFIIIVSLDKIKSTSYNENSTCINYGFDFFSSSYNFNVFFTFL